jgi:hypothetical protein
MSDRELSLIPALRLSLVFAVVMSFLTGCERTETVSQPKITTAEIADPKSAEAAPLLLLEDEPENAASSESAADNSRCFVCHMNYMQEKLAVTHAQAGVGCAKCHGPSDAHIADESWASGGNGTAPDIIYPRDKINSSCMTCHAHDKIDTPQHQAIFAGPPGTKVCTDCHGNHRLPQRRCKWK